MIGRRLARYEILRKLGEGGMGDVYLARDRSLGRPVALKLLPEETRGDRTALARLEREAKAIATLNHPGIVTLHSLEEAEGLHFLTLEFVEGQTLDSLLPDGGFSPGRVRQIAIAICEALAYAHARGVTHRDLKPANVMITDDGRLKVLDFGLAKARAPDPVDGATRSATPETLTRPGFAVGTLPYMSPEQLSGEEVDSRTDLFSLGVMLYELATGERPFRGPSAGQVMASILRDEPDLATGRLPGALRAIVDRCLRKNPQDRYDDVGDVLADLRAWNPSGADATAPTTALPLAPGSGRFWPLRRPLALVAGALLVALLAIAVGHWFDSTRRTDDAMPPVVMLDDLAPLDGPSEDAVRRLGAGLRSRLAELPAIHLADLEAPTPEGTAGRPTPDLRIGGDLRMSPEGWQLDLRLVDATPGVVVWSGRMTALPAGLPRLEADAGRRLADVLAVRLNPEERERIANRDAGALDAYRYLLRAHERLGDPQDPGAIDPAIALFRQAIRSDPGSASAHAGLSEALWRRFLRTSEAADLTAAESAADRAMEIAPRSAAARLALARVRRSRLGADAARPEIYRLLESLPNPDLALSELASAEIELGDLDGAERALRTATDLAPQDWQTWNRLGGLLQRRGRFDEASAAYARSAELAPGEATAPRLNQISLAIVEGRFDDALDAFEAMSGEVRDPDLALNLGTAYFFSDRADKWTRAEACYQLALRLDPENPVAAANLGDLYSATSRPGDAMSMYRDALERTEAKLAMQPGDTDLRVLQPLYAAKSGECDTATAAVDALGETIDNSANDLHLIGLALALCGEESRAVERLSRAVELGLPTGMLAVEPELDALRSRTDFRALLRP